MLSWKQPIRIIEPNPWPCTGHTKNPTLCLSTLSKPGYSAVCWTFCPEGYWERHYQKFTSGNTTSTGFPRWMRWSYHTRKSGSTCRTFTHTCWQWLMTALYSRCFTTLPRIIFPMILLGTKSDWQACSFPGPALCPFRKSGQRSPASSQLGLKPKTAWKSLRLCDDISSSLKILRWIPLSPTDL